ncbi:hypothetical protein HYDPIDRAFT_74206, partial [Hydnomerulius pinastri MD-312]
LAMLPGGRRIASGGLDRAIRIWDVEERELVSGPWNGHSRGVTYLDVSPDGHYLASGSFDGSVKIWEPQTEELLLVGPMKGHEGIVRSVVWTLDDEELISAADDNTIYRWNAATGQVVGEPLSAHDDVIWSLALSSDGKILASASQDKTVKLWNASTFEQLACFTHKGH